MENKYSTSGIGEDIIRSFTQIASAELHAKTLLEKRISEVENGLISEEEIPDNLEKIEAAYTLYKVDFICVSYILSLHRKRHYLTPL